MPTKIIELDQQDQAALMRAVGEAKAGGRTFRMAIIGNTIQWKVGEGGWSEGRGHLDPTSDYARHILRVTPAQVLAAKLLVELSEEDGLPVEPAVRAIAEAHVEEA